MQKLDDGQLKAAHHYKGPALVLAGPGSGKTFTLTMRLKYLIEEKNVDPSEILVITFTRAAAEEMKNRFLKITERDTGSVSFGTFHSVFLSILIQTNEYRDYKIAERKECVSILKDVLKRLYGSMFYTDNLASDVCDTIGKIKNGLSVTDEIAMASFPLFQEEMKKHHLMDFDDMQTLCLELLTKNPAILSVLRKKYRFILVDEFQDTNRIQYELIKMLAYPENNVFVVGDDDQSIYGFRGSDPRCMKDFLKDFPDSETIYLLTNYRSVREIVKKSSKLIKHNKERFKKRLKSAKEKGIKPVIKEVLNEGEEAAYIERIVKLYDNTADKYGISKLSIAILGRTHDACEKVSAYLSGEVKKRISILTFHASKGLEFDVCIIIGANEGVTPEKKAVKENNTEEERRAFYVAMTRTKKYLHILYTKTYYNKKSECSRFVKEIM
ncbi:MAG: ATP-dependent helicase [Lachnospiraceae bacterium]|nr:ATP-dependent helicase [Lachnospiraceae bacterium]